MKMQIRRQVEINKSVQNIYEIISDLSKWNTWSPWLQCEPSAKTEFQGTPGKVGQFQTWSGEVIGSGKMTIDELQLNQKVKMKLEFYTPWKSLGTATFEITKIGQEQSQVIWITDSNMPIFMFFFKKMMSAYIGSDLDRGLKMLKEYAETGHVVSKAIYQAEKDFSGFQVVGKKTNCQISDLSTSIRADFDSMHIKMQNGELLPPQGIVTLSHKHDIPNGTSEFTAGFFYKPDQNLKIPSDCQVTQISSHKALLVDFYGPYRNIGNGWSMIVSYQRGKKKKLNKKFPMYEVYKTMPDGRPEKDIHTQIILPVK